MAYNEDQPYEPPVPPPGNPWTLDEDQAAQRWADQYITTHQIPASWGNRDDLINAYYAQRNRGVGHDDAMAKIPGLYGWDKYVAPGGATPPPTPPGPKTTAAPTDFSYEEALGQANDWAKGGGGWGRALNDADIAKAKAALGFTQGARIAASSIPLIKNWITANKPASATPPPPGGPNGLPGGPTFNLPPPTIPTGPYGGPAPQFNAPTYKPPPEFTFDPYTAATPFKAPTAADLLQDPSYQFRFNEGQKGVEQSAAARGLLNTGNTLKDILHYGQDAASQEYKNVYDRNLNTYDTNEKNRFQAFTTNTLGKAGAYATNVENQYNVPYANAYKSALDTFNPMMDAWRTNQGSQQRAGEFNYNGAYNTWVQQFNNWRNTNNDWFERYFKVANA